MEEGLRWQSRQFFPEAVPFGPLGWYRKVSFSFINGLASVSPAIWHHWQFVEPCCKPSFIRLELPGWIGSCASWCMAIITKICVIVICSTKTSIRAHDYVGWPEVTGHAVCIRDVIWNRLMHSHLHAPQKELYWHSILVPGLEWQPMHPPPAIVTLCGSPWQARHWAWVYWKMQVQILGDRSLPWCGSYGSLWPLYRALHCGTSGIVCPGYHRCLYPHGQNRVPIRDLVIGKCFSGAVWIMTIVAFWYCWKVLLLEGVGCVYSVVDRWFECTYPVKKVIS